MNGIPTSPLLAQYQLLAIILTVLCIFAYASGKIPLRSDQAGILDIQIESSRSQPYVGTGLAIAADLTNLSQSTIHFSRESVTLTLPPELLGPFVKSGTTYYGNLPGLFRQPEKQRNFALQGGDTYKIFWSWSAPLGAGTIPADADISTFPVNLFYQLMSELRFIFFTPGDYKITVIAQYWSDLESLENKSDGYHVTTQSTMLRVAAPQTVILVGAALGGLIGYLIFPQVNLKLPIARPERRARILIILSRPFTWASGLLISMLLSAIVTILLARISETQFLIRITIADFWGAIAVGFMTIYFGSKALEQILGRPSSTPEQRTPANIIPPAPWA